MRTFAFCLVVCAALAGCSSGGSRPTAHYRTPVAATSGASAPGQAIAFQFQVGDELATSVWKEPELSTQQKIQADGTISPPLLKPMGVVGLSVEQTQEALAKAYSDLLKDPKVSVRIVAIHSSRVFVAGEVKTPQAVPLTGPMTAVESIILAGGFLEEFAAKSSVRVIRGNVGCTTPSITMVNADAVLCGRAADLPLQRGDIVYVPARGVTKWSRNLGQALAPVSAVLGTAGSAAAIVVAVDSLNR